MPCLNCNNKFKELKKVARGNPGYIYTTNTKKEQFKQKANISVKTLEDFKVAKQKLGPST